MNEPIISARNVCFQYDDSDHPAVDGVSLEIARGEFVAVLGRNGSGKSTFAKLLNALLIPTSGVLTVDGKRAVDEDSGFDVRRCCGMVFQNPDNQIVATIVEEDCAFGLENLGVEPAEIRRRVDETLREVGMADYASASPSRAVRRTEAARGRGRRAGHAAEGNRVRRIHGHARSHRPARHVWRWRSELNREEDITVVWITHFMDEAVQRRSRGGDGFRADCAGGNAARGVRSGGQGARAGAGRAGDDAAFARICARRA